jgi:tyrosine-protein phosphatase YwqE
VFNWLRKKNTGAPPLGTDLHAHLLPGLDDGVQTVTEALAVIGKLHALGYRKMITTPHVMSDTFKNTALGIRDACRNMQAVLQQNNLQVELQAAAEYYLDEQLTAALTAGEPLLTFGKRYVLFELNFMVEPLNLNEFIFSLITSGYTPVLAHPERYLYFQQQPGKLEDLLSRGVLFQLNILSLTGYYSKAAATLARLMTDNQWVHFAGSDCHNLVHAQALEQALGTRHVQKLLSLPLLNHTL